MASFQPPSVECDIFQSGDSCKLYRIAGLGSALTNVWKSLVVVVVVVVVVVKDFIGINTNKPKWSLGGKMKKKMIINNNYIL